jgi:hypothetical protein
MREQDLLAAVRAGQHEPLEWAARDLAPNVRIEIACDALSVGGIRRAATPQAAQHLADHFDAALWTVRVSDLAWKTAEVRILPQTQPIKHSAAHACSDCGQTTTSPWERCLDCGERWHSAMVESAIIQAMRTGHVPPLDRSPLVAPVGKQWVLDKSMFEHGGPDCMLYGWQKSDGKPWQPLSGAHPLETAHVDYSMFVRLWRPYTPSGNAVDWAPALAVLGLPDRRIQGVSRA